MMRRALALLWLASACSLNRLDLGGSPRVELDAGDSEAGVPLDGGSDAFTPIGDSSVEDAGDAEVPGPTPIRTLALGGTFSCAVRDDGAARCWGSAAFGELGIAPGEAGASCAGTACEFVPRSSPGLVGIASLALGESHGCFVDAGEALRCWGDNRFGQLARDASDADAHAQPQLVAGFDADVYGVASGRFHSCAIREGKVYCFGLGHLGQLGVAALDLGSCSVDAALLTELGIAGASAPCAATPVQVPGIVDAMALTAFEHQTCVMHGSGAYTCFGANDSGQLGSAPSATLAPTPFARPDAHVFALGGRHGCATFDADERLRCWGLHDTGQLGVGSSALASCAAGPCTETPSVLADLLSVDALSLGRAHSCALVAGTVTCWGSDEHGQLGNSDGAIADCGGTPCARTPVATHGLDQVEQLVSGARHSCALRTDDSVLCWGDNGMRQCGEAHEAALTFPWMIYGL